MLEVCSVVSGPWKGKCEAVSHSSYGQTGIAREKTSAMRSSGCVRQVRPFSGTSNNYELSSQIIRLTLF